MHAKSDEEKFAFKLHCAIGDCIHPSDLHDSDDHDRPICVYGLWGLFVWMGSNSVQLPAPTAVLAVNEHLQMWWSSVDSPAPSRELWWVISIQRNRHSSPARLLVLVFRSSGWRPGVTTPVYQQRQRHTADMQEVGKWNCTIDIL